jgi:cytosine/uracil/thiamine/allantoin permease
VVLRIFVACMWFGMQAYWGGQATRVLWGAIIPGMSKTSAGHGSILLTVSRIRSHGELLLCQLSSVDQ